MGALSTILLFGGAVPFFYYLIRTFLEKHWRIDWAKEHNEENMRDRMVIITGASKGIGFETAFELARRHAKVIVTARTLTDAVETASNIRKKTPWGDLIPMKLDLGCIQSIKEFCDEVKKSYEKIDILINNAGVLNPTNSIEKTVDGFETQFGVNHLGHFCLTNLLLPLLQKATNSRIIILTSGAFRGAQLNFDDLNCEKGLFDHRPKSVGDYPLYNNSKLANVLFGKELYRRLEGTGVHVYIACPGNVMTSIGRHVRPSVSFLLTKLPFILLTVKTPNQGCQTTVYCAVSNECASDSGKLYRNSALWDFNQHYFPDDLIMPAATEKSTKVNDENALKLWEESEKCLKMKFAVSK